MANMKLINECNMFLNSIHNAELDKRTVDARMLKLGLRAYVTLTGEGSENPDVVRIIREGAKLHPSNVGNTSFHTGADYAK